MKSSLIRISLFFILLVLFIPNFISAESKTFIKEYTYQASDEDSKNSSRTIALREVKRLLLEELGTYLESITEVQNFQLTKDLITTLTAGIVKTEIVAEKWNTDSLKYWLKARIVADTNEVIGSIDVLRKDREKTKELEEARERSDELLKENARLRKELTVSKGNKRQNDVIAYNRTIRELTATDWFEKGYSSGISGDYSYAIDAFSKAIELNPENEHGYLARGYSYSKLGNYNQAIKDYDKSIALNPANANAYNNRGDAYKILKNYNQAIKNYSKAIEISPQYANSYFIRGLIYDHLGNYNQAIMDYNKTIELDGGNAEAYYFRAAAIVKYYPLLNQQDIIYQAINDYKIAARLGLKAAQDYLKSRGYDW
jgi:tetratricopeptide (TPR) repeat protein